MWLIGCHTGMWSVCVWPLACICKKTEQYWIIYCFDEHLYDFCSWKPLSSVGFLICQRHIDAFNPAHQRWISPAFIPLGPAFVFMNLSATIDAMFLKSHAWWILMWASWAFFWEFRCSIGIDLFWNACTAHFRERWTIGVWVY